ncbi:MAG: histidine kinase [Methylomonas sp.]|nr:MAG: histidine kinase [Methylomonas sp.]
MGMGNMLYFPAIEIESIETQLINWRNQYPLMGILVMLPEAEKQMAPTLQALCNRQRIPLCGAIFPQLIFAAEFHCSGVCLLRFDRMPYMALHDNVPHDTPGAVDTAENIAAGLVEHLDDDTPATLFLLLDAMLPNISTLLDEIYLRLANRVNYAGVNAGSETFQPMLCLFDNQKVVGNGVLALLLKPHQGAILEHGYQINQQLLPATSTDGNRIIQIDWRPAFEVYQELVQTQYGVEINRDNFYQYAVHFPFGILRANHSVLVRIPVMLDDDNALFCVGEVPPNAMLTLLEAPQVDSQVTLQTLQQGLAELRGDPAGSELLLFYCAGRRLHLGEQAALDELGAFSRATQTSAMAGALALGEIGGSTLWGYPLFHNGTLLTAEWGRCP